MHGKHCGFRQLRQHCNIAQIHSSLREYFFGSFPLLVVGWIRNSLNTSRDVAKPNIPKFLYLRLEMASTNPKISLQMHISSKSRKCMPWDQKISSKCWKWSRKSENQFSHAHFSQIAEMHAMRSENKLEWLEIAFANLKISVRMHMSLKSRKCMPWDQKICLKGWKWLSQIRKSFFEGTFL